MKLLISSIPRFPTHYASGRLGIEVNTNHPLYCHVHCSLKPAVKSGIYHVYLLLECDDEFAAVCSVTCECAAGYAITTQQNNV